MRFLGTSKPLFSVNAFTPALYEENKKLYNHIVESNAITGFTEVNIRMKDIIRADTFPELSIGDAPFCCYINESDHLIYGREKEFQRTLLVHLTKGKINLNEEIVIASYFKMYGKLSQLLRRYKKRRNASSVNSLLKVEDLIYTMEKQTCNESEIGELVDFINRTKSTIKTLSYKHFALVEDNRLYLCNMMIPFHKFVEEWGGTFVDLTRELIEDAVKNNRLKMNSIKNYHHLFVFCFGNRVNLQPTPFNITYGARVKFIGKKEIENGDIVKKYGYDTEDQMYQNSIKSAKRKVSWKTSGKSVREEVKKKQLAVQAKQYLTSIKKGFTAQS